MLNLSNVRPGEEINALLEVVAKVFQAPTSALAFFLKGVRPHPFSLSCHHVCGADSLNYAARCQTASYVAPSGSLRQVPAV